jgi:hypothetical protein
MPPLSFLNLLIHVLSHFFVSLPKVLLILLIFSKNQNLTVYYFYVFYLSLSILISCLIF